MIGVPASCGGRPCCRPHLAGEAQRGEVPCPRSHSDMWWRWSPQGPVTPQSAWSSVQGSCSGPGNLEKSCASPWRSLSWKLRHRDLNSLPSHVVPALPSSLLGSEHSLINQAQEACAWLTALSACLGFLRPTDICPLGVMHQQLFFLLFVARAGSPPQLLKIYIIRCRPAMENAGAPAKPLQ